MNAVTKTRPDHKSIYSAVARAMGQVKRLAKDSRNADQKYDFASIDDFLAMTGPILAENGLVTVLDEESVDEFERQGKYGATNWLRIRFALTTFHESGECLPTVRRTVEVIRTGAQSFGSAQSYVLKQYQRALLNIPTGDKDDADFAERGEGAPTSTRTAPVADERRPEPARDAGPTAAQIAADSLANADTLDALAAIWKDLPRAVQGASDVIRAKDKRKAELQRAADLGYEIPY